MNTLIASSALLTPKPLQIQFQELLDIISVSAVAKQNVNKAMLKSTLQDQKVLVVEVVSNGPMGSEVEKLQHALDTCGDTGSFTFLELLYRTES